MQPEQGQIHTARSPENCVTKAISTLQLAPCSALGTEKAGSSPPRGWRWLPRQKCVQILVTRVVSTLAEVETVEHTPRGLGGSCQRRTVIRECAFLVDGFARQKLGGWWWVGGAARAGSAVDVPESGSHVNRRRDFGRRNPVPDWTVPGHQTYSCASPQCPR